MSDCICQHVGYCDGSCQHPPPIDRIAELEEALAAAGGLDRTRVIIIEDLRRRLREAEHEIVKLNGDLRAWEITAKRIEEAESLELVFDENGDFKGMKPRNSPGHISQVREADQ